MACCIVALELLLFQVLFLTSQNYILATVGSFIFGVVLNWFFSRKVVFGASTHHPLKEFVMVAVTSIGGVVIQLVIVFGSVELLHLYPLLGKVLSIGASFVWNYWFRVKYIFNKQPEL